MTNECFQIPILDLRHPRDSLGDDDDAESSPLFFRTQYLERNQPCLLRGLSLEYFGSLDQHWRRVPISSSSLHSSNSNYSAPPPKWQVNYDWFRQHVGPSEIVPLRVAETIVTIRLDSASAPTANHETEDLDDMGRAKECPTRRVALEDWIQMLQPPPNESIQHASSDNSRFYLKDWHLQLHLEQRQLEEMVHGETRESNGDFAVPTDPPFASNPSLYQVPPHFEYDLLNHFLLQFCEHKSDYRFCYWGPRHSYTGWHTDVLQSYSWSYNVVGRKQWTFRVPHSSHDATKDAPPTAAAPAAPADQPETMTDTITIIQEAGDCIFVPSQWQHYVINLEETLSVNHNWITTANLPACWECLLQELYAVQDEMQAWVQHQRGTSMNNGKDNAGPRETSPSNVWDWEALENMLRGCVGLDVTSFVWMMFTRLVDLVNDDDDDEGNLRSEALQPDIDEKFFNRDTYQPWHQKGIQSIVLGDHQPFTDRAHCPEDVEIDLQHYYDSLDVMRLATMLRTVWTHPDANAKERMNAVVQCPELSTRGVHLITEMLNDVLG